MMVDSEFLGIYIVAEGIGMKESQFAFDGFELVDPSHWWQLPLVSVFLQR